MSSPFSTEDKQRLLHNAFVKSMDTGKPFGAVALRLLSTPRHERASGSPDEDIAALSRFVSGGRNTVLSMAYVNASLYGLPSGSPTRTAAFKMMLETGSPFPGLSVFSDWKND